METGIAKSQNSVRNNSIYDRFWFLLGFGIFVTKNGSAKFVIVVIYTKE